MVYSAVLLSSDAGVIWEPGNQYLDPTLNSDPLGLGVVGDSDIQLQLRSTAALGNLGCRALAVLAWGPGGGSHPLTCCLGFIVILLYFI